MGMRMRLDAHRSAKLIGMGVDPCRASCRGHENPCSGVAGAKVWGNVPVFRLEDLLGLLPEAVERGGRTYTLRMEHTELERWWECGYETDDGESLCIGCGDELVDALYGLVRELYNA